MKHRLPTDRRMPLLLLLATAPIIAQPPPPAAPAESTPRLTGSLETCDGLRILRLWGSPAERGFAHGYLLASDIHTMLTVGVLKEINYKSPVVYETAVRRGLLTRMDFEPRYLDELRGMYRGMVARLGPDGMFCPWLQRPLLLEDLQIYNCFADFLGLFCSSFTVWGDLSADGVLTARNLDYPVSPDNRSGQIVVVQLGQSDGRKDFVSVLWPGQIGCTTAMNSDGVTLSLHDSNSVMPDPSLIYKPRLLQMRSAIEAAAGETAFDDVCRALATGPSLTGNNVHVSRPARYGRYPAVVIEYDGRTANGPPLTVRTPDDNAPGTPKRAVICTNHYRTRRPPTECGRFSKMQAALRASADSGQPIALDTARQIMDRVARRQDRLFTLHTVYFQPDRLAFDLALCAPGTPSTATYLHRLQLADLLARR
jgi:hypothetical protein